MEVSSEEGRLVVTAQTEEEDLETERSAFAEYAREELADPSLDPEEFLEVEQRLPVQRLREGFLSRGLGVYRRLVLPPTSLRCPLPPTSSRPPLPPTSSRCPLPPTSSRCPLPPGLFKSIYGPHGLELVLLQGPEGGYIKETTGVKVTGDPNVPFDEISFKIDHDQCLNIPLDIQGSSEAIQRFMENPQYIEYQVGYIYKQHSYRCGFSGPAHFGLRSS